jgi:hypothetical protein
MSGSRPSTHELEQALMSLPPKNQSRHCDVLCPSLVQKKRTMLWVMSGLRAVVLLKRSSNQHTVNACPEPQTYSKHVRGLRLADKCDPEVDDTGGVWVVGRIPKEIAQSSTPRSSRS